MRLRSPRAVTSGRTFLALGLALASACAPADDRPSSRAAASAPEAAAQAIAARTGDPDLFAAVARIDSIAAGIDSIFQPLPLLSPAQEETLRRFDNARQLARARALGIEPDLPSASLAALEAEGGLVRLADTRYWVIRDLDYSQPLVVPAMRALLVEIGERFHARLTTLGAPPFRLEISSLLRTAADQDALRRVNPNAVLGESTHQYGTTVDILYSAYASPQEPISLPAVPGADWSAPLLERYGALAAERVAARRSLELKRILGEVLIQLQEEGRVMVTLERQQPVFHITTAAADGAL